MKQFTHETDMTSVDYLEALWWIYLSRRSVLSQHDNECDSQITRSDVSSSCDRSNLTLSIFKAEVDDGRAIS